MQRLFDVPEDPHLMVAQTTRAGSVFDVGALFEIPGQDVNRALFRHVLYSSMGDTVVWEEVRKAIEGDDVLEEDFRRELLSGPLEELTSVGALTHHVGMLDARTGELTARGIPENPSAYNVVRKFRILKPRAISILGSPLYDYSVYPGETGFVVPLEFIVRFGMTSASSVYRRYLELDGPERAALVRDLGVKEPLCPWQNLPRPVTDFTTKFEPSDRMLTRQEALVTSGLSGRQFSDGTKMAILGSWAVRNLAEKLHLRLWDIKWEFARDGDFLVFVDTIDPDSFRATLELDFEGRRFVSHVNKQAVRDYFLLLHGDWIDAIKAAKARGRKSGTPFTEILREGQEAGDYPGNPRVTPEFLAIQERKMTTIRECLVGNLSPDEGARELGLAGGDELAFFRDAGKLDELFALNGVT